MLNRKICELSQSSLNNFSPSQKFGYFTAFKWNSFKLCYKTMFQSYMYLKFKKKQMKHFWSHKICWLNTRTLMKFFSWVLKQISLLIIWCPSASFYYWETSGEVFCSERAMLITWCGNVTSKAAPPRIWFSAFRHFSWNKAMPSNIVSVLWKWRHLIFLKESDWENDPGTLDILTGRLRFVQPVCCLWNEMTQMLQL